MSAENDLKKENLLLKYKVCLLKYKLEIYRQRAIDEVLDHHKGATLETAILDVDTEMEHHLSGVRV